MAAWFTSRLSRLLATLVATGLLTAVLTAGLVQTLELSGLTEGLNELSYGPLMRLKPSSTVADARVLLVYCERSLDQQPEHVLQLVRTLDRLQAPVIGLTVPYAFALRGSCRLCAHSGRLVCTAPIQGVTRLPRGVLQGDAQLVHPQHGVYTEHRGRRSAGDERLSSLEAVVSRRMGLEPSAIPCGRFLVDFRGGIGSLPHVDAARVLRNELTSELVRGRAVLLGLQADPLLPGVATPTTQDEQRMSLLEYHGHALNSILTQHAIRPLDARWQRCLILSYALLCVVALRQVNLPAAALLTLGLTAVATLATWFVLHFIHIWIPWAPLLLVPLISGLLVLDRRLRFAGTTWRRLAQLGFAASPRHRHHPPLPLSLDPWQDTALMLDQLFELQRGAWLILPRGRRRLQLVHCLRCTASDVLETNRRIREAPFADAIEQRGLLRCDPTRPFFRRRPHEQQFLLPLIHRGQVKGVLALAVAADALQRMTDFPDQARSVADVLAELASRHEAVRRAARRESSWFRWLWTVPEQRRMRHVVPAPGIGEPPVESMLCRRGGIGGRRSPVRPVRSRGQHERGYVSSTAGRWISRFRSASGGTRGWADGLRPRRVVRPVAQRGSGAAVAGDGGACDGRARRAVLLLRPLGISAPTTDPAWSFEPFRMQGIQVQLIPRRLDRQLLGDNEAPHDRSVQASEQTLEQISTLTGTRC